MRTSRAALLLCAHLCVASCDGADEGGTGVDTIETQSGFKAGIREYCHIPRSVLLDQERPLGVIMWIGEHVTDPEARAAINRIGNAPREQRPDLLDQTARDLGLPDCPLSEFWRQSDE